MTHFEHPGDLRTLGPATDDFLQGVAFQEDPDGRSSGEVRLYQAVIARVWSDAFILADVSIQATDRPCDPSIVRAEARRWLTLDFGEWKADREDVCVMADLDPDAVRNAAVKRLELAKATDDVERRAARIAEIDAAFLDLVAREDNMKPWEVNRTMKSLAAREARL
jgi:hypothetical protein